MFNGIIEDTGVVKSIDKRPEHRDLTIESDLTKELSIDQSISHNGVCLTVVDVSDNTYKVTIINETLNCTNFGELKVGDKINLERALKVNDSIDGHIIQGHVDLATECTDIFTVGEEKKYQFHFPSDHKHLLIPKGSICVNGISLTIADLIENYFSVAIIPYTFEHTNFKELKKGMKVNVEYDMIGKYIARMNQFKN